MYKLIAPFKALEGKGFDLDEPFLIRMAEEGFFIASQEDKKVLLTANEFSKYFKGVNNG